MAALALIFIWHSASTSLNNKRQGVLPLAPEVAASLQVIREWDEGLSPYLPLVRKEIPHQNQYNCISNGSFVKGVWFSRSAVTPVCVCLFNPCFARFQAHFICALILIGN
jgi:hypothetical protein